MNELNEHGLVKSAPDTIFTFTGGTIRPLDPDPSDINIEDIAHSLSQQCRWTGHTSGFYSVAEHSMKVAELVSKELKLTALLHDASEAYLADLARPIKHAPDLGDTYRIYEKQLEMAIAIRFNIEADPLAFTKVKDADDQVLRAEAHQLLPEQLRKVMPKPKASVGFLNCYSPIEAERLFLATFRSYGGQS